MKRLSTVQDKSVKRSMFEKKTETAIPWISVDTVSGLWVVHKEAQDILKSVPDKISILAVGGRYRGGKSFLLNRAILNNPHAFGVGNTTNSCTKGIWIYPKPVLKYGNVPTFIVDTEGISAPDTNTNHDCRIFALAILLSQVFLYNQHGPIDETALQQLGQVVQVCQDVVNPLNGCDQTHSKCITSTFVWVARDFSLRMENTSGQGLTPPQYLEAQLADPPPDTLGFEEKVLLRKSLRSCFPNRTMVALVRPAVEEAILQQLNTVSMQQLRPEFVKQLDHLQVLLGQLVVCKQFRQQDAIIELTGACVAALAEQFVGAFNSNTMPRMESAITLTRQIRARDLYDHVAKQWNDWVTKTKVQLERSPWNQHDCDAVVKGLKAQIVQSSLSSDVVEDAMRRFETQMSQDLSSLQQLQLSKMLKTLQSQPLTLEQWRKWEEAKQCVAPLLQSKFESEQLQWLSECMPPMLSQNEHLAENTKSLVLNVETATREKLEWMIKVDECKTVVDKKQQEIDFLTLEIQTLQSSLDKQNEMCRELSCKVADFTTCQHDLATAQATIQSLQQECEDAETSAQEWATSIVATAQAEARREALRADQIDLALRDLTTAQTLLTKEKQTLQERLQRTEESLLTVQQQVVVETRARNDMESKWMREKAALELSSTGRIRELEAELSIVQARNFDLKRQIEDNHARLTELKNRGELEALKQEISATKGQLESAHATIDRRNNELLHVQEKNRQLTAQLQKLQRQNILSSDK